MQKCQPNTAITPPPPSFHPPLPPTTTQNQKMNKKGKKNATRAHVLMAFLIRDTMINELIRWRVAAD